MYNKKKPKVKVKKSCPYQILSHTLFISDFIQRVQLPLGSLGQLSRLTTRLNKVSTCVFCDQLKDNNDF